MYIQQECLFSFEELLNFQPKSLMNSISCTLRVDRKGIQLEHYLMHL